MTKDFLEIDLVNIIASMALDIPNYPRIFYEAGYRIEYLEKEFYLNNNGKKRSNLILFSTMSETMIPYI